MLSNKNINTYNYDEILLKKKDARHRTIKLIDFSNLHPDFKETFCKLQFSDPGLRRRQKITATELIEIYHTKVSTNQNTTKILNFEKISQQSDIPEIPVIEEFNFSFKPWKDAFLKWWNDISWASLTHYVQGWWTSPRLFGLRDVRIEIFTHIRSATTTLSSVIRWGGLSYAASLIIDLPTILYETFKPLTDKEKAHNWDYWDAAWERFKSVLEEKDELGNGGPRWYRVTNDKTWFDINLAGIILLIPGLVIAAAAAVIIGIINVIGFAIDVCNEAFLGILEYLEYAVFEEEIEERIQHHEDAKKHFHGEELELINHEIERLKIVQTACADKKVSILKDRLRVVISLSLLVFGMFLCFFPPTSIIGAKTVGAGMALLFGSTGTGFVPRLWKWCCERFCELFKIDKKNIEILRAKLHIGYCITLMAAGGILTFLSMGFPALLVPGLILLGSGAALLIADSASPYIPDAFKQLWKGLQSIVDFFVEPEKIKYDYVLVNDIGEQIQQDDRDINLDEREQYPQNNHVIVPTYDESGLRKRHVSTSTNVTQAKNAVLFGNDKRHTDNNGQAIEMSKIQEKGRLKSFRSQFSVSS